MKHAICRFPKIVQIVHGTLCVFATVASAQSPLSTCVQPLCVNRSDDDATAPVLGMLRYAISSAPDGAVITFDPALNGKTIELDRRSPGNHIKVTRNLSIEGPGSNLLSIDGGNATRIFFLAGDSVQISGLTLANGAARAGDGGVATGGAGGGGGAAGLGGAVFLNRGSLSLNGVILRGNRSIGGNGGGGGSGFGSGKGGGGGGFGGNSLRDSTGGAARDLEGNSEGSGGAGGGCDSSAEPGGEGGWAGGGGGGGYALQASAGHGAPGGPSGFAGGVGGAGGFLDTVEGTSIAPGGGYGGSALGGAIFVRSGQLQLRDTTFLNNSTIGGLGAAGAPNGIAKAGALFICSSYYCGPGHDGKAITYGKAVFKSNSAAQASDAPACLERDDADVCGPLAIAPAAGNSKLLK